MPPSPPPATGASPAALSPAAASPAAISMTRDWLSAPHRAYKMDEMSFEGWHRAIARLNDEPTVALQRSQTLRILEILPSDHLCESQTCFGLLFVHLGEVLTPQQKAFLRERPAGHVTVGYGPGECAAIMRLLAERGGESWENAAVLPVPTSFVTHDGPPYRRVTRFILSGILEMEQTPWRLERAQAQSIQQHLKRALTSLERVNVARRKIEAVLTPQQRKRLEELNAQIQKALHQTRNQAETNAIGLTHDELETMLSFTVGR